MQYRPFWAQADSVQVMTWTRQTWLIWMLSLRGGGDPRDLAEQVIEPLRPPEQRLDHVRRPPVTDPGQRPASGDEPLSCSAMSGS
jgi:hypothetical protein